MSYRGGDRESDRRAYREDSLGVTFELLSDPRRRFVVSYLQDHRRAKLDELADVVTGWEESRRGDAIATREKRDAVAVALHHVDLPKLAAWGVLEYDHRLKLAEFVDLPDPMADILAIADDRGADGSGGQGGHTSHRRR